MRLILLLCSALAAVSAQAFELQPFKATYTADWKAMPLSGSASRALEKKADGRWELTFKASMLVVNLTEKSTFRQEGTSLHPLSYRYERGGFAKSKILTQNFDWNALLITGKDEDDEIRVPLVAGLLDKSTYQVAIQRDVAEGKQSMSYQVISEDEVETYDFRVLGEEMVDTKAGQIDAIKVERVRDPTQSKRETILWMAKDWNYLLVRLHQTEKDGKEYHIMLEEGTVNGQTVSGRK